MSPSLGSFDPDKDEVSSKVRPGWSKAKTALQREALLATGHRQRNGEPGYFSSQEHKKRFKALEEKAIGADDESYLFQAWMRHNIDLCRIQNRVTIMRPMGILLAMCENEDRRVDWQGANRRKVLESRVEVAKSMFYKD